MKTVSRDQTTELGSRFLTDTDWGALEHDALQAGVIQLPRDELGRRFTAFLRNGCQLVLKGPSALVIDRTKPFDPVAFIGKGWSVVEKDERALALGEIDFSKVTFESGLGDDESVITGEEKLKRLKTGGKIRLDAKAGQELYEEKGQTTLRWLYDTFGITWFEFAGTILRYSGGFRCFLYLRRRGGGSWHWDYCWLDSDRYARYVSPLSAS